MWGIRWQEGKSQDHLPRLFFEVIILQDRFASLVTAIAPDSKMLQVRALAGGVSAQTSLVTIQDDQGNTRKLVVRCHGQKDLELNPYIASHEFRLLSHLYDAGLPVPRPQLVDQDGVFLARPCLVYSYIPGHTLSTPADLSLYLKQMAETLALIHRVSISELSFLPRRAEEIAYWLSQAGTEDKTLTLLQKAWPWRQRNKTALLHGDYWPSHLLWQDERLVGVIDWEDAALGDPLADLASARLELLWSLHAEAMEQFTTLYCQANPVNTADLPYYDLLTALRVAPKMKDWGVEKTTQGRMQAKLQHFITTAMDRLER